MSNFNRPFGKNNRLKICLKNIKQRCTNPNHPFYKNYGGRGIGCIITLDELQKLWIRDKGSFLKQPSIDRIDNNGHYEYSNCRFIEMHENSKKSFVDRIEEDKTVINHLIAV